MTIAAFAANNQGVDIDSLLATVPINCEGSRELAPGLVLHGMAVQDSDPTRGRVRFGTGCAGDYLGAWLSLPRSKVIWRGVLEITHATVWGGNGIIIMHGSRRHSVLFGRSLGWPQTFPLPPLSALRLQDGVPSWERAVTGMGGPKPLDAAILLPQPGGAVYGHHLLDLLPRIEAAQWAAHRFGLPGPDSGSVNPIGTIIGLKAEAFVSTAGLHRLVSAPRRCPLVVKRLLVPLATRFSPACLDVPMMRLAHDRLAETLRPIPGSADGLVYLSRRHIPGRPQRPVMTNHDAMDAAMRDLGFSVECPKSLSLKDQAATMARARVVVGEDGSALHNVFLCRNPETHLLSICPSGRMNFFHVSFLARPGGTLHMCFDGINLSDNSYNVKAITSAVRAVLGHSA